MNWFEPRRHAYPWRGTSDPYAVLVSEIMLQQTQAARVVPVFERFLGRFPTVAALADASRADAGVCQVFVETFHERDFSTEGEELQRQ